MLHACSCYSLPSTVFYSIFVNISIFILKLNLSLGVPESFSVTSLQSFIEVNSIKEISLTVPSRKKLLSKKPQIAVSKLFV